MREYISGRYTVCIQKQLEHELNARQAKRVVLATIASNLMLLDEFVPPPPSLGDVDIKIFLQARDAIATKMLKAAGISQPMSADEIIEEIVGMHNERLISPLYTPEKLLDFVIKHGKFKNDAALARALDVPHPVVSKTRNRVIPIGPMMLLRLHEVTDLSITELRSLMGGPFDKGIKN